MSMCELYDMSTRTTLAYIVPCSITGTEFNASAKTIAVRPGSFHVKTSQVNFSCSLFS